MEERLGLVQEEIRKYSQSVQQGEADLEGLMSKLNVQLAEFNRYNQELNRHLQNQEIQNLNRNLQEQSYKEKETKKRGITLREELDMIGEDLIRIRNQTSAADLDKCLQNYSTEIQRYQGVQTKNLQTQEELGTKCQKQKESIGALEREIDVLLENKIIEEQSLEALEKEAAEKRDLSNRDEVDFKLHEKKILSDCKEIDTQIRQSDWKGIEKTSSFGSSFIFALFITISCSLFCVILYNLPQGTLYKLFEI